MSDPGRHLGDGGDGRTTWSRAWNWVLLRANRLVVTGGVLGALFVVLLVLGAVDPVSLRETMARGDPVDTLFQALVPAIVTGVTLVVTINQLVLSQELGSLGDQHDRMRGAMEFRYQAETVLSEGVSPSEPASFLRALLRDVQAQADTIARTVDGVDPDARDEIVSFADRTGANAASASDRLEQSEFGTFDVVLDALTFDYSRTLYGARRLRSEHGEQLPSEPRAALQRLTDALELFSPAREHVKTLYFQWELINLSRLMLYAAVPALVVTAAMVLYVDPGSVTGATLGVDHLVWLVSAAFTVALLPFALLLAYILRIATVAKRTLAIGPFLLQGGSEN